MAADFVLLFVQKDHFQLALVLNRHSYFESSFLTDITITNQSQISCTEQHFGFRFLIETDRRFFESFESVHFREGSIF